MRSVFEFSERFLRPELVVATIGTVIAVVGSSCADNLVPTADVDAAPLVDAPTPDAEPLADVGPGPDPLIPQSLGLTGLYFNFASKIISPLAREYRPQVEFWSDGSSKRRWIELPEGQTIDTSDMDFWIYPEGTKIWKQFSRDGLVVETRLIWKQEPLANNWRSLTYAWNAEQTDAFLVIDGVTDALGTGHNIPRLFDCRTCHQPQPDFVLGYAAISLDGPTTGYGLDGLVAEAKLSVPPSGPGPVFFPLPGDAEEQAVLGYFHSNCGGCHFDGSEVHDIVPLTLRVLEGARASFDTTPTFLSTVGVTNSLNLPNVTAVVEPGDPAASAVSVRINTRGNEQMPPIATDLVDTVGSALIDGWITGLLP